jgi:hypothetical protein
MKMEKLVLAISQVLGIRLKCPEFGHGPYFGHFQKSSKLHLNVMQYIQLFPVESFGINGNVLDIIRDFLSNRTITVQVEGKHSTIKKVLSGVPQGSVLGSLLFVLYVNDLPDSVKNQVQLFADDLKLICDASDDQSIIDDIKELEYWENIWLLRFNPSKCKVMHLEFNGNPALKYCLGGVDLETLEREKDLGVVTNKSLLWNENIKSSISKANRMICWIVRNMIARERHIMLAIYKSLIRPHLEYCVEITANASDYS